MARYKRPFGVVAGPIIMAVAALGYWGFRSAEDVKDQVDSWAYAFEYSADPIRVDMPDIPMFPPLYVNGDRVGRIETVTVLREEANTVDSLTVVASVRDDFIDRLEGCALRFRIGSYDGNGYARALRCTRNTDQLVPFGHLTVSGADVTVPIMVRAADLPCDDHGVQVSACLGGSPELTRELEALQRELDRKGRQFRIELREDARTLREELRAVREDVRPAVRVRIR